MLGSHVLVMAAMGFVSRLDQRAADPLCEIVPGQKASSSNSKIQLSGGSRKVVVSLRLGIHNKSWGLVACSWSLAAFFAAFQQRREIITPGTKATGDQLEAAGLQLLWFFCW
jgi:hypothetical protein